MLSAVTIAEDIRMLQGFQSHFYGWADLITYWQVDWDTQLTSLCWRRQPEREEA